MRNRGDHGHRSAVPSALPFLAAGLLGGVFCVAPPGLERGLRHAALDAAGPALAAVPRFPPTAGADDDGTGTSVAMAGLAREIARLRGMLAGGGGDPLVTPTALSARTLGAAADRGRVAELLIAAVGDDAAAPDAAVLTGDAAAVDVGADRRVRVGDLAVVGGGVAGRVSAVGRWTSAVRPVADPAFRLAVSVRGVAGVLEGGAEPAVRFLPAAAAVRAGDAVVADGGEAGGAGLPVAVVASAERTPAGEWAVTVRPLASLTPAGAVQIVRAGLNRRRVPAGGGG